VKIKKRRWSLLQQNLLSVSAEDYVNIYEQVLARSLNEMTCDARKKKLCIWKEHVRSSIVRTILECAYPYIVKINKETKTKKSKGSVIVICPDGEYHEIGARMVADFFTLAGFNSTFVGGSTPKEEFLYALDEIKPDILALSVTNYYNIISAKRTIQKIRDAIANPPMIVVGGNAFDNNPDVSLVGADRLLTSFRDVLKLGEEF
jgi:methanogenic corrinoid protein MtbC1